MDDVEVLLSYLDEVIVLLRQYGVDLWADWMQRGRDRIARGDAYGLRETLGAFGGMGSFNDLYICPENGNPIRIDEMAAVNERLRRLRNSIYALARDLERQIEWNP